MVRRSHGRRHGRVCGQATSTHEPARGCGCGLGVWAAPGTVGERASTSCGGRTVGGLPASRAPPAGRGCPAACPPAHRGIRSGW